MYDKPIAVIISDIHFTPATLELASQSLLKAQFKAKMLDVPLIIAGDLLDTKAIIRAECANRLLQMLSVKDKTETYILVGNHDLVNEKGEENSLNFLWGFANIIKSPVTISLGSNEVMLIPYYSNVEKLRILLQDPENPRTLIMHQGLIGANQGHYIQDKSALTKEDVADYRVISGHYHKAQDIKCGRPRKGAVGLFSYIGNPYSLSFGEAGDGPKGFQILHENGLLSPVKTNLRRHVIVEANVGTRPIQLDNIEKSDLVWLKLTGPTIELQKIKKKELGEQFFGHSNFKLDLIPTDSPKADLKIEKMTDEEIFDKLIEATDEQDHTKAYLKVLWRDINETT